jgi:hypothetical protein
VTSTGPALSAAYAGISAVVTPLGDAELLRSTRCRGWTVADLLLHLVSDAQRALVALASPVDEPPDVDYVSYWAPFRPGGDGGSVHTWWVRRSAAAFAAPSSIVRLWTDTGPAAVRAGLAADPIATVTTQGHVLQVDDLLATLTTEAAVHHLDLTLELPAAPAPDPAALAIAARTLDGLLAGPRPATWSLADYLLKGTGRVALDDADRRVLGPLADRFPLLG